MRMIKPLGQLYEELRRLPGVGSKTALRLAYHIIDLPEAEVKALAQALLQAKTGIKICQRCFNLSDGDLCEICRDKQRDQSLICVVEDPQDVIAMVRSHGY